MPTQRANDKTTAWTPVETTDPAREATLKQAYLLCQRGKYDDAKRLLQMLQRSAPQDPDVQYLLARIASTEIAEKRDDEGLRTWRYRLGMQTSWSRFCWYVGAVAAMVYGLWNAVSAVQTGLSKGFAAEITTMLSRTRGKYGPTYYVPWTRPVYYDLLYGLAFLAVALIMLFVVYRVSRGAAMWEELGDYPGDRW